MPTDNTPFPALTPSQRLHLEIYGYVVLEKLLTEAEIAALLEVIYQIEADFHRTGQLPRRKLPFIQFNPRVLPHRQPSPSIPALLRISDPS